MSRPSRSQNQVRVGSFANGSPRLLTFHRPNLGRKRRPDPEPPESLLTSQQSNDASLSSSPQNKNKQNSNVGGKNNCNTFSGKPPHPDYVKKGPLITNDMFEKWTPDLLNLPSNQPVRSSRNPNPVYA